MIYFVQPVDGGPIKIGTTEDFGSRLKALELHYGRPLAVLATMDGGRDIEAELHAKFSHLRFGRTEQFRPAPDLMEFIGRPLFAAAGNIAEMPISTNGYWIRVRCTQAWADWVECLAREHRTTTAGIIDRVLQEWAESKEFDKKPPKRVV